MIHSQTPVPCNYLLVAATILSGPLSYGGGEGPPWLVVLCPGKNRGLGITRPVLTNCVTMAIHLALWKFSIPSSQRPPGAYL